MHKLHIHEHTLAVRQEDEVSQVDVHTFETGNEFNFTATKISSHSGSKTSQKLIETSASDGSSVLLCIDLLLAYKALYDLSQPGILGHRLDHTYRYH
ncbi:unnamed protein product [Dibothriocephalus latus]|uniref:Uncharacterized protein n=1 Tax=Dibothriocephalus latus TaxID=60516 RepID=A0A3P7LWG7_DIBLA|nr:unnamed protein product [Dibothriocephalus latus]